LAGLTGAAAGTAWRLAGFFGSAGAADGVSAGAAVAGAGVVDGVSGEAPVIGVGENRLELGLAASGGEFCAKADGAASGRGRDD
jgi:hypothetical protein